MTDAVVGLPTAAADAASNQIGAALQVAGSLEDGAGGELVTASKQAFIDGASSVYIIAGIVALIGMAFVVKFMPGYDLVPGEVEDDTATRPVVATELAT
jgi:predicted lipid-binding transport protein (Tim44 family)